MNTNKENKAAKDLTNLKTYLSITIHKWGCYIAKVNSIGPLFQSLIQIHTEHSKEGALRRNPK